MLDPKNIGKYAGKQIKKVIMSETGNKKNQKSDKSRHAETVVRNHMLWSMGTGFVIPIPIADVFAVSAVQLDMIRQLCRVYEKEFSETQGKAIVTALTTSTLTRAGARSLVKLIPVVGTVVGGVVVSVMNGASTYALGQVFKRHFESGGTILDFDTERLKKVYREQFEKGKKVAEEWAKDPVARKSAKDAAQERYAASDLPDFEKTEGADQAVETEPAQDPLDRLKQLAALKEQGVLSEEEFQALKKKIIDAV